MSDETTDAPPPAAIHSAPTNDDSRREWVAPAIAELPISASQGPVNSQPSTDGIFPYS